MDELQKYTAFWKINNEFNTWNEFFIVFIHDLTINSSVLIYWTKNMSANYENGKDIISLLALKANQ